MEEDIVVNIVFKPLIFSKSNKVTEGNEHSIEIVRIMPDGRIYWRGKYVEGNEIYKAFREYFEVLMGTIKEGE